MKKQYLLAWVETIKYRIDGSTYIDFVVKDTTSIGLSNGFVELLKKSKDEKIALEDKIAENELDETMHFIKRIK